MSEATVRRRVVVQGRVQGVAFRASTEREATRAGVHGWVRNRPDGSVETVFEGPEPAVQALVEWCRGGPRWAQVTTLAVFDEPPEQERGFAVRT